MGLVGALTLSILFPIAIITAKVNDVQLENVFVDFGGLPCFSTLLMGLVLVYMGIVLVRLQRLRPRESFLTVS